MRDAGEYLTSEPIGWRNGGLEGAVSTRKTLTSPPLSRPEEPGVGQINSLHQRGLQGVVSPGHVPLSGKVTRGSKGSIQRSRKANSRARNSVPEGMMGRW